MTPSVSHTARTSASVDNGSAKPLGFVSCTQMLRHAHHLSEGDITKALEILRALSRDSSAAFSAIRVLHARLKKTPGADLFSVDRHGFVRVEKRPAREIFTIAIGDLRFERSGDSVAVFRFGERIDRVDLPQASEMAFLRAAHDYSAAVATPAEVA